MWSAIAGCLFLAGSSSLHATGAAVCTVYVNKYFEVRAEQAPTKYVFNGDTRVARVVGSLSANTRTQRLQVYPGWNLCSLAVTATNALAQISNAGSASAVDVAYQWFEPTAGYVLVGATETLAAGTILWLRALTNANLNLTGVYSEPTNRTLAAGQNFVASAGLEAWCFTNSLPNGVSIWKYDPFSRQWRTHLTGSVTGISDFPGFVAPGETVFIQAAAGTELEVPTGDLRIKYYHEDHLGSSSVVSDAAGRLIEETAYFPFGAERNSVTLGNQQENYKFNQREQDRETGNLYMHFRYMTPVQGRFLSADPVYGYLQFASHDELASHLMTPQLLNPYAFAGNNPIHYTDPAGLQPKPTQPPASASAPSAQPSRPATPPPAQSSAPAATPAPAAGPKIVLKPDRTVKEQATGGKTSFQITGTKISSGVSKGVVTGVKGPQPKVEIETTYREGVDPNVTSGYGRGTTKDDKDAGNTSLRFHESQHQRDYQEYLKQHPFPVFQGREGMTVPEFQKAMKDYYDQVAEYRKKMEAESKEKTDCVGDKSEKCK